MTGTSPDAGEPTMASRCEKSKAPQAFSGKVEALTRTVYRARGGRMSRFTLRAALRDAAKLIFWRRHPCGCLRGNGADPPENCGQHEYARRVVDRLVRLWMRRSARGAQ